jgi:hypothetical protein
MLTPTKSPDALSRRCQRRVQRKQECGAWLDRDGTERRLFAFGGCLGRVPADARKVLLSPVVRMINAASFRECSQVTELTDDPHQRLEHR